MKWLVALLDDEIVQIDLLKKRFKEYEQDHNVSFQFLTFESAEAFLFYFAEDKAIDLLVLDIEMDGMNGMELAQLLRKQKHDIKLLFVTGYTDYIAEGYEVSAIDYILKPVKKEKFYRVIDRFRKLTPKKNETILIETSEEKIKLNLETILSLEADGHQTIITTTEGMFQAIAGLGSFEDQLSSELFIKPHRSYLVNLAQIKKITKKDLYLDNDSMIPVSRRLYKEVNQAFIHYHKEELEW
ncbi:LytR/AlgR family response regulator transcription factor [Amphibacillus sp. Q70]|uniref:LytR/AlgR family response regulator transcription factor n=1 Tax=Amphibacillus sp. Q70 TaxID=3453416 RepID=UPI003F862A49